ncbi:hypothetical protein [Streptomyces fulvorobeus]|uniref:Uncharacterized protein n=1 Tax=Streptomyces fulvorobeus TaxID=284028 RepID=A0A7J0CH53_9ACTN|nr:hypothetical protein [Streptomyces fulvorobeus]NYE44502.1 hypothetical protein [Streptomyces fulvorobeus]GFN01037.1 hypothetical protein Sfulv_58470 [Streptomyces fulvorobeus]
MSGLGDGGEGGGTNGADGGPGHERLAALCQRLTSAPGMPTLGAQGDHLVQFIISQVRAGLPPEDLEDSFDELEDQLLAAGYSAGLGSYRTDTPPSYQNAPAYQSFPGPGHPLLYVLTCPLGHCARVEAPAPEDGGPPVRCVFGGPLREIGLHP